MARDGILFRWVGSRASHPTDPPQGHLASGGLGLRPGPDGQLPGPVYPGGLHGVDLLRAHGGGALPLSGGGRSWSARYSVWGYPLTPAVFALSAFTIVVNQIVTDPVGERAGAGFRPAGRPGLLCLGPQEATSRREPDDHRLPQPLLSPRVHRRRPKRPQQLQGHRRPRGKSGPPFSRRLQRGGTGPPGHRLSDPGSGRGRAWTCRSSPSPAPGTNFETPARAAVLAPMVNDCLARIVQERGEPVTRPWRTSP